MIEILFGCFRFPEKSLALDYLYGIHWITISKFILVFVTKKPSPWPWLPPKCRKLAPRRCDTFQWRYPWVPVQVLIVALPSQPANYNEYYRCTTPSRFYEYTDEKMTSILWSRILWSRYVYQVLSHPEYFWWFYFRFQKWKMKIGFFPSGIYHKWGEPAILTASCSILIPMVAWIVPSLWREGASSAKSSRFCMAVSSVLMTWAMWALNSSLSVSGLEK